jgi:uncharacterized membrane protein
VTSSKSTSRAPVLGWAPSGRRWGLEHIFLVVALGWGLLMALWFVPPLQVPDEGDHFFRAVALANGQLFADADREVSIPSELRGVAEMYVPRVAGNRPLPMSILAPAGVSTYEQLFNDFPGTGNLIRVPSRVASYGPVGYLPQAVGIGVARQLGADLLGQFYAGRVANLFVAVLLLFFAIRVAPFGKGLFFVLALLPMTMFEVASLACDALTIAGAFFFVAYVLALTQRDRVALRSLILTVVVAAVLLTVKPGYSALALLVLLIRPDQVGGRAALAAWTAAAVGAVAVVTVGLFAATSSTTVIGGGSVAADQVRALLGDPTRFANVLASNVHGDIWTWLLESIAAFGWLNLYLAPAAYFFALVLFVGVYLRSPETVPLTGGQRLLLVAVGVATFLTIATTLYIVLEPLGSDYISMQGRYLSPVLLVFSLAAYGLWFAPRRIGRLFVTVSVVVLAVESLRSLAGAYQP